MANKLGRLKDIGFTVAGEWKADNGGIVFELTANSGPRNVLYAFVVAGEVMYVGKTVQTLRSRMAGYKVPAATQSTNIRNKENIQHSLERNLRVEIYALPGNGHLRYGSFQVNLAAGLEDDLIRTLAPPWNGRKKESPDQTLEPIVDAG